MKSFKTILDINFQLTDEWEQLENIDKSLFDNTVEHFVNKEKNLEFRILFNTKLWGDDFESYCHAYLSDLTKNGNTIYNKDDFTYTGNYRNFNIMQTFSYDSNLNAYILQYFFILNREEQAVGSIAFVCNEYNDVFYETLCQILKYWKDD